MKHLAIISVLSTIVDNYESALSTAIFDEDSGEKIPKELIDLVDEAREALDFLRRNPLVTRDEVRDDLTRHAQPAVRPSIVVTVRDGMVETVYSNTKEVEVEILDLDGNNDIEEAEAAEERGEEFERLADQGKLFRVA